MAVARQCCSSMDPKAGYVIGIKFRGDGLTTVVCDLDAQVIATENTLVSPGGRPSGRGPGNEQETRKALHAAAVPSKVLGVGIGLSGVIDSRAVSASSRICSSGATQTCNLSGAVAAARVVDNDMNTLAVAEKWAGDALPPRDFVTLSVGRGIGLGIVIDRHFTEGQEAAAASSDT